MSTPQIHDLSNVNIFSSLTPEQRRDFEMSCRWRRFGPNEQIIDQNDDSKDVYFITRGRVRVVNYTISGKEVALEDLKEGDCFGELAALDGFPRSSTVVALVDSDVAKIAPDRFLKVTRQYPDVAFAVMLKMSRIIRSSTERIIDLSTLGANNRVHGELLRQAREGKNVDNTAVIQPIPVHSDMASRASTTRETVARVISDLTKKGVVKREKDFLLICDIATLESIVEEVRGF